MNLLLHSPSNIVNPLARQRFMGFGTGSSGGPSFVGPLDAYATGLHSAHSIGRRLLASYTGPLFRVRRGSDSTETDINADPITGAADIAALQTFCSGTTGWLRRIYDQSGASWHLQQATAAQQPQIVTSGGTAHTTTGGGLKAIDTSGLYYQQGLLVTRTLSTESNMVLAGFGITGPTNYVPLSDLAPNSTSNQQFGIWEGFTPSCYYGYRGSGAGSVTGIANNTEAAIATRFDGTNRRHRANGTWGSAQAGSSVDFQRVRFMGLLAEFLGSWRAGSEHMVWTASRTEADVEAIELNIRQFYT
jgi:hypothetical protein